MAQNIDQLPTPQILPYDHNEKDRDDLIQRYEQLIDPKALRELDLVGANLENESSPMVAVQEIIDVIGVLSGLKPGAIIDERIMRNDLLSRLGLAQVASVGSNVCVSRDIETAERLAALHKQSCYEVSEGHSPIKGNSLYECDQEIGQLLGYPETATRYFLDPIARFNPRGGGQEFDEYRRKSEEGTVSQHFQRLILSPAHYEEELASYSQPLEEATRTLLPNTYRMLERFAEKEQVAKSSKERIAKLLRDMGEEALAQLLE